MASNGNLWLLSALLYSLSLTFVTPVTDQFNQFTSSIAPGQTSWYPLGNGAAPSFTVRSDPPTGTVTLTDATAERPAPSSRVAQFQHCYITAHSCPLYAKTLANYVKNHGDWKFDANGLMKLHVDIAGQVDTSGGKINSDRRREGKCENKSKKNPSLYAAKKFPNECKNVATLEGINTLHSKYFTLPVKSVDKQPIIILGPADPTDNTKNVFSSLVYTCDKFPSASWIEGGSGLNNAGVDSAVICALNKLPFNSRDILQIRCAICKSKLDKKLISYLK